MIYPRGEFMIDRDIGSRIRKVRIALGMSQMKLSEIVGVSFQQIQKYESGANKVSIEKLRKISEALNVPIGYFIGGGEKKGRKKEIAGKKGEKYGEIDFEELSSEEIELLLKFRTIKNNNVKEGIKLLISGVVQLEKF